MKDEIIILIRKWFKSKTGIDLIHDPSLISLVNEIKVLPIHGVMGSFIKPLVWDDETKIKHVYKCVSASYVNLPVQGNWKSHIAICDEDNYGFKATLWLMNGGYGITKYCRTIDECKKEAEKWWINFVSKFLNCP